MAENSHLLPTTGSALDLACGLGANALLLARYGLETHAWDSSPVAIERLRQAAQTQDLAISAEIRDVERHPPPADTFDVIVVSRFLCRALAPLLLRALKPGGLLFYQTFVRDKAPDIGPSNPDYLLEPNELLALFADLRLAVYREEARLGDTCRGFRNEAMLVAWKTH